jgi:uncharacterized protein YegL
MRRLVSLGIILLTAVAVRGQNPFTIRCDTIDASRYPLLTMKIGIDSLANPILDLVDSDLTVTGMKVHLNSRVVPGSCENDSLSVLLVMDESGSMGFNLSGTTSRLQGAITAARSFVNRLAMPPSETGLLSFADASGFPPRQATRYLQPFTESKTAVSNAIGQLTANGGTNIDSAVRMALSLLKDRKGKRVLLLLTDGHENPDYGFARDLNMLIARAVAESVYVFTIGLYPQNNQDRQIGEPLLTAFALGTKGAYYRAPTVAQLMAAYDSIYYRLLRPHCTMNMAVPTGFPFCDSGTVTVDIAFHRHGDTVACQTFYVAPYIPPSCDCQHVVYTGIMTLSAPFPNPAAGSSCATVSYSLPRGTLVSVHLINAIGTVVATPVTGPQSAGLHAASVPTEGLAAGLYYWQLNVGDQVVRRPLMVVK